MSRHLTTPPTPPGGLNPIGGRWRLRRRGRHAAAPDRPSRRPRVEELEERNLLTAVGTWTPLTNMAPDFVGTMTLLSDGSVLMQGYDPGSNYMRLTPDARGSYINGTISTNVASMSTTRLYYASNLLPSGKLFVLGGEYSDPNYDQNWTPTGEIYDPVANTWTPIAPFPDPSGHFGDDPSMLLPNGKDILTGGGAFEAGISYIYHSDTNTWSGPISKVYNDSSDEETWVKLPNGNVLTYDIFASLFINGGNNAGFAEMFNPNTNAWVDISPGDGTANGSIPSLSEKQLFELGPMLRLQDGRIFVLGDGASSGATAFYNPSTNTWSAGPSIMGTDANGNTVPFGPDDGPAAELPNGDVVFAADSGSFYGSLNKPPQELFIFDPRANTITPLPDPPQPAPADFAQVGSFLDRMIVLPTGQLLLNDSDPQMWIYTPPSTQAAGKFRPDVDRISYAGTAGTFKLTGEQLNGQSSGTSYGDDVESDENYPIVRLRDLFTGNVYYARTTNWTNTGVATGEKPESVNFTLPAGINPGLYTLVVSGAGISSNPVFLPVFPFEISGTPPFDPFASATAHAGGGVGGVDAFAVTLRGSANHDLAGVSLALTAPSGVSALHAAAQQTPAPQGAAVTGSWGSPGGAPAGTGPAAAVTDYVAHGADAKVVDALFSTGLDETPSGL